MKLSQAQLSRTLTDAAVSYLELVDLVGEVIVDGTDVELADLREACAQIGLPLVHLSRAISDSAAGTRAGAQRSALERQLSFLREIAESFLLVTGIDRDTDVQALRLVPADRVRKQAKALGLKL